MALIRTTGSNGVHTDTPLGRSRTKDHTFNASGKDIAPAARQQAVNSRRALELVAIRTLVGHKATGKPSIDPVHFGVSMEEGQCDVPLGTEVWEAWS